MGFSNSASEVSASLQQNWDLQAEQVMSFLIAQPESKISSRLLLCQAAKLRVANRIGDQSTLLAELNSRGGTEAVFAKAESQVSFGAATPPLPVVNLRMAVVRPLLDAKLTDSCWEQADEIFLTSSGGEVDRNPAGASGRTLLMMAWDEEFLFIGGRIPYVENGPPRIPLAIDRDHDAIHGHRDRLEFEIDIDRDYATSFAFAIDQTGRTSERCWTLRDWNPDWYVAVADEVDSWRFEAAIPHKHLSLGTTAAGDLWGVRLQRVAPGSLRQTLARGGIAEPISADATADSHGRGLVRLIRTQKK